MRRGVFNRPCTRSAYKWVGVAACGLDCAYAHAALHATGHARAECASVWVRHSAGPASMNGLVAKCLCMPMWAGTAFGRPGLHGWFGGQMPVHANVGGYSIRQAWPPWPGGQVPVPANVGGCVSL